MKEKPNIRFKWMHLSWMDVLLTWLAQLNGCRHLFYLTAEPSVESAEVNSFITNIKSQMGLFGDSAALLLTETSSEWQVYFYSIHGCRKVVHSFGGFFSVITVTLYLSPSPLQPWLGLVPRWRPGEGQAFVELFASWRCVQCGAPVSAPVRLQLQALWRHGCKPVN